MGGLVHPQKVEKTTRLLSPRSRGYSLLRTKLERALVHHLSQPSPSGNFWPVRDSRDPWRGRMRLRACSSFSSSGSFASFFADVGFLPFSVGFPAAFCVFSQSLSWEIRGSISYLYLKSVASVSAP